MALNIYRDKNIDFYGIRITKTIKGKTHRKYYSFRKDGGFVSKKEEKALEVEAREKLQAWEELAEQISMATLIGPAGEDGRAMSALGARGLTASFTFSIKESVTPKGLKKIYYPHPVIIVRGGGSDKYKKDTHYYFGEEGFDKIIKVAIDDLLTRHDLHKNHERRIMEAMDVAAAFRFSRTRLNKTGKNITIKQMRAWGLWE